MSVKETTKLDENEVNYLSYIMLNKQNELNNETINENWKNLKEYKSKEINWNRCIHMELSELIESTPWKHWKSINGKVDKDNIQIEAVDTWHFILSEILKRNQSTLESYRHIESKVYENLLVNQHKTNNIWDYKKIIEVSEDIIAISLTKSKEEDWDGFAYLEPFFKLCQLIEIDLKLLCSLYFGKNTLNSFRQENGYKEGKYQKIWNGKEDNVYMLDIIRNNPEITESELKTILKSKYDIMEFKLS